MTERRLKITQGTVECVAAEFGDGENNGLVALWVKMPEPRLSKAEGDLVEEAFAVCNRLDLMPSEMEAKIAELEEEIERGPWRRKFTHEWYERHYGKLHDWARKVLPEPFRNQFFNCIANGTYGHDDIGKPYKCVAGFMVTPSGYFQLETAQEQILFDQCVRAEDAEAKIATQEREIERLSADASWAATHRSELEDLRKAFAAQEQQIKALREALDELIFASRGLVAEAYIRDARAALSEGGR